MPEKPTQQRRDKKDLQQAYQQLKKLPKDSTQRVAFVTFSYVKYNDADKLLNFLLPAVDTWAAPVTGESGSGDTMLYVVLSQESRGAFEQNCRRNKLCRRLRPIYVDCPEGEWVC